MNSEQLHNRWTRRLKHTVDTFPGIANPPVEGVLTRMVGLTLEAVGCQAAIGSRCDVVSPTGTRTETEVVGFSGGYKYLFPGVSGPKLLNFFHWLAAVITNPKIIGHKWTAVRKVIDYAGGLVDIPVQAFCMVVKDGGLGGIFEGTPPEAWDGASDLSGSLHITYKKKPFHTILSCAPPMYDELWVGGKCMYKLEPVLADDGELIIYAPHINEVSLTHGELIYSVGYHCRDYFLNQWDRFKDQPWGVLAHSTQVYGLGTYENGVEKPRARVTLATGLSPEQCQKLNLGYRDPASINVSEFANREEEGILYVPKAGEQLFQLEQPPAWARP